MMEDHYEALGVGKDATAEQITDAYRRKARKAHPDAGGDKEQFQLIAMAYSVLSNADKRDRYDRGENVDNANPMLTAVALMAQEAFMSSEDPMQWMRGKAKEHIREARHGMSGNAKVRDKLSAKLEKLKKANEKCKNERGYQFMVDTISRFIDTGKQADVRLQESISLYESVLLFIDNIEFPKEEYQPFTRPIRATGIWVSTG